MTSEPAVCTDMRKLEDTLFADPTPCPPYVYTDSSAGRNKALKLDYSLKTSCIHVEDRRMNGTAESMDLRGYNELYYQGQD